MKCNSMRAVAFAVPVVIASCSGSASITSPLVTVHGIVRDSVLSTVIANASVSIAGHSTVTDSSGAFSVSDVPAVNQKVIIVASGFEPFIRKVSFSPDGQQELALRRVRPFIKDFAVTNTQVSATLVDLQGASTLNVSFSYVTIPNPGGIQPVPLSLVPKTLLDPFSLKVSLGGRWEETTEATWVLRDSEGNIGQFICTKQSCTEIFSF
jgi:hypothetical protein